MREENYTQPTWQLNGMTCAFSEPEKVKTVWAFEAFKLLREYHVHLADIKLQIKQPATLKLSRQRLQGLVEVLEKHLIALDELLMPLNVRQIQSAAFISYLNESPGPSQLADHYANLFRDWSWGETENQAALSTIEKLATQTQWGRLCVLGAGACRLAYDIHRRFKPAKTVVSDFNPLLMLAAQKLVRGEKLDLVEFPLMPSSADKFAIKQSLQAPQPVDGDFEFALTDATQPGFTDESFDTLLTPWLIDVIAMDLQDFLPLLNRLLPVGGTWINFGPLGFNNPTLASHYALEEVRYLVEKAGFEIAIESYEMIPYMQNPSGNSHRSERVWTMRATKIKTVELKDELTGVLSPWEIDPETAVELPVREMNLVEGHRFNAEVLAMVDGKNSFNEIVAKTASQFNIPNENSAHLVSHILRMAEALSHSNPLRK